MYKEKDLYEKVEGHIKEQDLRLLKSLVSDLDEFNAKYGNKIFVTYIDFDNVGNDSEFDPYETFSIRIHNINKGDNVCDEPIHDYLDIHQLDDCLCALELYHEEIANGMKEVNDSIRKCNDDILDEINKANEEGKILFMQEDETIVSTTYENFTKQPIEAQLHDLNRLKEAILAFRDENDKRWINDMALVNLLIYYSKCNDLNGKLKETKN